MSWWQFSIADWSGFAAQDWNDWQVVLAVPLGLTAEAGAIFAAGQVAGSVYVVGQVAGAVYTPGAVIGQVVS